MVGEPGADGSVARGGSVAKRREALFALQGPDKGHVQQLDILPKP